MAWKSFVAVGDSFTEGLADAHPAGTGYRGWADRVAGWLAERTPDFTYANLAVRGKLFDEVRREQVPEVLRMRPELISFNAGGNDALRLGFDGVGYRAALDEVIGELRSTGADVLIMTAPDLARLLPGPAARLVRPRNMALNEAIRDVAAQHDAILVELWDEKAFGNRAMWDEDRLHLSAVGHRWVAGAVARAVGVPPKEEWTAPVPPTAAPPWLAARADTLRWARRHLAPWVMRRIRGASSADGLAPKRPELEPLPRGAVSE